jgi:AraC-like DNA-binding protein
MDSTARHVTEEACCPRSAALCLPGNAASIALRDGVKVSIIRPGGPQSVLVTQAGAYFFISVAGQPYVRADADRCGAKRYRPNVLHIMRQSSDRCARRIEFDAPASLAVVVYFPETWCAQCPRGAGCRVGRFLIDGGDAGADDDEEIELDAQGRLHARAMLELSVCEDADILTAEQGVLALLAWAYARHARPCEVTVAAPSVPPKTLSKLRLAADILSQRLDNPPTISELSSLVGMNECDLKRCFKCLYGEGIASYSRNRRLAAAQALLMHSALSIAEVALEVGYSNPSQFARAFRQHFDVNPATYRRVPHQRTR